MHIPPFPISTIFLCFFVKTAVATPVFSALDLSDNLLLGDNNPPVVTCPPNATINPDPGTCHAVFTYQLMVSDDKPGWIVSRLSGLPSGSEFPVGIFLHEFLVTDIDGNTATCSFTLTVADIEPPVAICKQSLVVSIGSTDDPNDCYLPNGTDRFASVLWLPTNIFDNGSYDLCSPVRKTVRRKPPYSTAITSLNQVNGIPPCNAPFPDFPSEYEKAILEWEEGVKFYCGEVDNTQDIVLRVYQLNGDGTPSVSPTGDPVFSECTVSVTVEDKIAPTCVPPPNVTVSCEQFDPLLWSHGTPTATDNCCISQVTQIADYTQFDTVCNRGTILRTFSVSDCSNQVSTCTHQVVVTYNQNYFVRFPDDVRSNVCSPNGDYGKPSVFGNDCEVMGISFQDQVIDPVPNACIKIWRDWTVINWCTYNPNLSLTNVPNPEPSAISTNPANLPGPVVSACDASGPWSPTVVKVTPSDTDPTNYCVFWSPNSNGYRYTQRIVITDDIPPTLMNCMSSTPLTFADTTQNDPYYWNAVFNPDQPAKDRSEMPASLNITTTDGCFGSNIQVSYLLFLDLDGDEVQETVVSSLNLPPTGHVYYGNAFSPNYSGGTLVEFDKRPVPASLKWRFARQTATGSNILFAAVRWNNSLAPNTFVVPELPGGKHKIRWQAMDQCGNYVECEQHFTISPTTVSAADLAESNGFVLFQNEPNPFVSSTTIRFHLPETSDVTLSVFNAEGQRLFSQANTYGSGLHHFVWDAPDVPTGLLFFRLEAGKHVAWRKMLRI